MAMPTAIRSYPDLQPEPSVAQTTEVGRPCVDGETEIGREGREG
jgi:hypothetical protein